MRNKMLAKISLCVLYDTDMSIEEILLKLQAGNIVGGKLNFVVSDGSEHCMDIVDKEDGTILSFVVDGEETIEEPIVRKNIVSLKKIKVTQSVNSATKFLA